MKVGLALAGRRMRGLLPVLSCLLLAIIGVSPMDMPHFGSVGPVLALMAVFYWSIFRADLMTMLGAFLIGLVVDLLSGGPIGLYAVLLLLTHALAVSQRRVFLGSSFLVNWWGYGMVALGSAVIGWVVACLLNWQMHDPRPLLTQLGLSLGLYPLVYWLLSWLERRWLRNALPV